MRRSEAGDRQHVQRRARASGRRWTTTPGMDVRRKSTHCELVKQTGSRPSGTTTERSGARWRRANPLLLRFFLDLLNSLFLLFFGLIFFFFFFFLFFFFFVFFFFLFLLMPLFFTAVISGGVGVSPRKTLRSARGDYTRARTISPSSDRRLHQELSQGRSRDDEGEYMLAYLQTQERQAVKRADLAIRTYPGGDKIRSVLRRRGSRCRTGDVNARARLGSTS